MSARRAVNHRIALPNVAASRWPRGPLVEYWKSQNGRQSGDPAKLARALITIASQEPPPRRFIAGADAIATAEQKIDDLKAQCAVVPRGSCSQRRRVGRA